MRYFRSTRFVLVFALSFLPVMAGAEQFRIAGTVVSATTGAPLARARVTIADTANREDFESVVTSEDGRFAFNQLPRGKFSLHGAKRGFIAADYMAHEQFSTAIPTGVGFDTEHLVLQLAPFAILSGKVLDESGDPVRHASVSIYRENRGIGESQIMRHRVANTDDQGFYEFNGLDSGTYFVSVEAKPWYAVHPATFRRPEAETGPSAVDPSLDVAYPVTYYANATEPDEATPIPLRGGDHTEIDFHLNPVPALHIQVRAFGDNERGFTLPMLERPSFDSTENVEAASFENISGGLFEMTGIPPGHYVVHTPGRMRGQPLPAGEMDVELNQNSENLDVSAGTPGSSLKASIQVVGESTLPQNFTIALRNSKMHVVGAQEVNSKGEVDFGDIAPGRYEVLAVSPGKRYSVARISSAGNESEGHFLNVAPGSSLSVSVSLVAGTAQVDGYAERAGKPVAGVMVVLAPNDPESNRQLFRRDQSDLDGSFTLRNVIPASYSVCAIENGWDLDWAKPAVIAHYCEHGRKMIVPSGATGAVHLPNSIEVQSR